MKRKRVSQKTPREASTPSDLGAPELHSKNAVRVEVVNGKRRLRVLTQTPLDFYLNREYITKKQFEAGEQFHKDFYLSGMLPSPTPVLGEVHGSSGNEAGMSERQVMARERWRQALDCVAGECGKSLVLNVCCYGHLLKDFTLGYYAHSALMMPRFKEALDNLKEHYCIK